MQLDTEKIRRLRTQRAWTQQQLAEICGLSLRTIQRVETQGIASLETGRSLAAAFERPYGTLLVDTSSNDQAQSLTAAPLSHKVGLISVATFIGGIVVGACAVWLLR